MDDDVYTYAISAAIAVGIALSVAFGFTVFGSADSAALPGSTDDDLLADLGSDCRPNRSNGQNDARR